MENTKTEIRRGEIYLADLSPVIGSEQGGERPVLILQNDVGNRFSPTTIVAAITGREKVQMPTHVFIPCDELPKASVVLLEQIRTIDKCRLKRYVGRTDKTVMLKIDHALAISLGINYLLEIKGEYKYEGSANQTDIEIRGNR